MINTKRVVGIAFFLFIMGNFVPKIYRSVVKASKLEKELLLLKEQHTSLQKKIDGYKDETEGLKNIENKEKRVRNNLQMIKPGEIIYRVTN